jgi:hypothetical protein
MATRTENFMQWCGLFGVNGTIDNTHIIISKPITPFPKDYYYHKNNGYSIQAQVMVDSNKKFLDFVWDFQVVSTMLELRIGLHCVIMFNITICLIPSKVWREFLLIFWGIKDTY